MAFTKKLALPFSMFNVICITLLELKTVNTITWLPGYYGSSHVTISLAKHLFYMHFRPDCCSLNAKSIRQQKARYGGLMLAQVAVDSHGGRHLAQKNPTFLLGLEWFLLSKLQKLLPDSSMIFTKLNAPMSSIWDRWGGCMYMNMCIYIYT